MTDPINFMLLDLFPQFAAHLQRGRGGGGGAQPTGRGNSAGSVYNGEVPPQIWIQREQQRAPVIQVSSNSLSSRHRERGNQFFQRSQFDEAVKAYSEAILHDPNDEISFSNRSFAYYKLGKFSESLADAKRSIEINPNFYKGYYRLGFALMSLNQYPEALRALREAHAKAPPGENRETIRIEIVKCESKMTRAPSTPLLKDSGEEGKLGSLQHSKVDLKTIVSNVSGVCAERELLEGLQGIGRQRAMLSEHTDRSQRVKALMAVANSANFPQLKRDVEKNQEALRRASKMQDRRAYYDAKDSRDQAMQALWDAAKEVSAAVGQLEAIATEERRFFEKYGGSTDANADEATKPAQKNDAAPNGPASSESIDKNSSPTNIRAVPVLPSVAEKGDKSTGEGILGSSSSPQLDSAKPVVEQGEVMASKEESTPSSPQSENIEALLTEFDEVMDRLKDLQKPIRRTEECAAAFLGALKEERAAVDALRPDIEKAKELDEKLKRYARRIASTSPRELCDSRLEVLESFKATADSVISEAATFQKTSEEGDMLLAEEASLERDRLQIERQRIQLQAEIEWFKVKDEPQHKIVRLQDHLSSIKTRLASINEQQAKVQRRIVALIDDQHPELAWKSTTGGSRILRMVKGSGLWVNCAFNDFEVVSTLSSTANSKVYHATWRGEHVALKEIAVDGERAKRRFQSEINIIATSNYPNMVRLQGVFFDGPFAYIIMPYYPRGSLKTFWAKKEALPWYVIQDILRQLVSGVAYLHERGIIHADIKPSNILLTEDFAPVIIDFGIAKDVGHYGEREDITTTQTGVVGTTNYMAPELARGDSRPTTKSDVWSLGITFYEIATTNAHLRDPANLPSAPQLPFVSPGSQGITVSARLVGNNDRLADLISSMLVLDTSRRPAAHDLLGHPYFNMSLLGTNDGNSELLQSDEKLEAIRAFIHALRTNQSKVLVSVSRNMMVESVNSIFENFTESEILSPLMVVFQGESGIDEGALTSEMLNLYYQQLVTKYKALVTSSTNTSEVRGATGDPPASDGTDAHIIYGATYVPSDAQNLSASLFECLGKMLIKSIFEGRPLPIQLNPCVFRYLCGKSPTMMDLELYDEPLATTLKKLPLLSEEDLLEADMDFSDFPAAFLQEEVGDRVSQSTKVTLSNVRQFIDLRVKYELVGKRIDAYKAIKKGFHSCPSMEFHLRLLTSTELMLLLCGQKHLQPALIISALEFQGFPEASHTPEHLRTIINDMSQNNLRRFLQLCTSMIAMPEGGMTRKIKVQGTRDTSRFPVGHGCVYQLDVPDYNDLETLKQKLNVALAHVDDGFHIQ